jgi:hypothetical protein
METCNNNNTLIISRPSLSAIQLQNQRRGIGSGLGPVDPLDKAKLGPRKSRDKVREQCKDYVLLMLGAPVIKIELDEQQLDLAVDQTLKIMEMYAGKEYYEYYVFNTTPGKSVYEMPPEVGYIRHVHYKATGTLTSQSNDLGGAIPIEYYTGVSSFQGGMVDPIQPVWGRMGEWTLYKQYEEMYSRISSALGGWEWVGGFKNIKLYPIPGRPVPVIVHYMQKMKDWDEVTQCMQEGALAHAKMILGRIRSKFTAPPGPGGGMQLDGQQILQEGLEEYKQWKEDLIYRYSDVFGPSYG